MASIIPQNYPQLIAKVIQGTLHYIAMWWASRQPCSDVRYGHSVRFRYPFIQLFLGYTWTQGLVQALQKQIHVSHKFLECFFSKRNNHLPTPTTVCYRPLSPGYVGNYARRCPPEKIKNIFFSCRHKVGGCNPSTDFLQVDQLETGGFRPLYPPRPP